MVRPASFQYNIETAVSNDYQKNITSISSAEINEIAKHEHDQFVDILRSHHIDVLVINDTEIPIKPDAIFPNNWISMHEDGRVFLFPMKNSNRALERREDIVQEIKDKFFVNEVIDWSAYERDGIALEGTGSIVFDHKSKVAYACISPRTDEKLFNKYCAILGYQPVVFHAYDQNQKLIYHTNVVMCVGDGFVVIGMESVVDEQEKKILLAQFKTSNLTLVDISNEQLNNNFAGNMLELKNKEGKKYLVMSLRAFNSLRHEQKQILEQFTNLLPIPINMIEDIGGGSARCMMAEIFCKKR